MSLHPLPRCPAVSPESNSPCVLTDTADGHEAGHESAYVDGMTGARSRACWATTVDDWHRWGVPVGIAKATATLRRIGRVHRPYRNAKIRAKRNRQHLRTSCGLRIDYAWPFRVDLSDPVSVCLSCYPEAKR